MRRLLVLFAVLILSACGGGGGSGSDAPPPSSAPTTPSPTTPSTPTTPPTNPTPPQQPFGLLEQPVLGSVSLPSKSPATSTLGTYGLVNAFPSSNLSVPVFLTGIPGESNLLIVQLSGEIVSLDPVTESQNTILDLSDRVLFAGEQGLLGLALDPDFLTNRFLYIHYSMASPRRSVISRLTWPVGDSVDLSSEKILLEVAQPFANHNGGMLAFGPDDYLYIGFGDGGAGGDPQNNAQNPANFLGSMLRIDVHPEDDSLPYVVPLDNPFMGTPGFLPETYAYGLRNPFRFSFDRSTGELWLGDVGQGAREEIDIIIAGGNYGWRAFEGTTRFDAASSLTDQEAVFPVFEYGRDEGVSVTGGYVYRGNALPGLRGRYIYTDFGSGTVWALTRQADGSVLNEAIASASSPTSFGEDNSGELFVLSIGGQISSLTEIASTEAPATATLLSETGLFADLGQLVAAEGLIEYDVNHGFWSDGVRKRRWFSIPDVSTVGNDTIGFSPTGRWNFPVGTVTLKHFETIEGARLETRLFVRRASGWEGFTYRWLADQSDAELLSGRETTEIVSNGRSQRYTFPGPTDCLRCHTEVAGAVLGINTRQLNRDFAYSGGVDNQLRSLNHIGLFDQDVLNDETVSPSNFDSFADVSNQSVSVTSRARAYLDVNCAQCHQPGGPTPVAIDLRFDTGFESTGLLDPPLTDTFGSASTRIIVPGDRAASVLFLRMQTLDARRMPPIASHVIDDAGLSVIGQWIDSL